MRAIAVIVCLLLPFANIADASDTGDEMLTGDTGDEMFKNVESEGDYADLLSLLDAALKKPINLLEADRETIGSLPWISPWLASRIVEMREAGKLQSLDDLLDIEGVGPGIIELIAPFVVVEPPEKAIRLTGTSRLRFISRPPSTSFENAKTYFTFRSNYGSYGFGVTLDKDKHETRINDFQSIYLDRGWASAYVVLGNFILNTGYGLVFSEPYGHSPSTIGPWRFSRRVFGIRPYTSTVENFMLTGGTVAMRHGRLEVCAAVSRSHLDVLLNDEGEVKSIQTSGTHVTSSEREGEDALREDLAGLALRYEHERLRGGITLLISRFDREFEPGAFPWLDGRRNDIIAAEATYLADEFAVFGEGGMSGAGGAALIGGVAFERPGIDMLALGRKYDREYVSLHGRPFSVYSRETAGEEGLFLRLTLKPAARAYIAVSNDVHRKDLGQGDALNPSGTETFLEGRMGFSSFRVALSGKITSTEDTPSGIDDLTSETSRYRVRLDLEHKPHRILWLRLRLEDLRSKDEGASVTEKFHSDLMRLDMRLAAVSRLSLKAGFYVFKVGDYSSRLYQYEPGLPYYPSLEMLKTDGSRWYAIGVLDLGRAGSATVKFGMTSYDTGEDRKDLEFDYGLRF